MYSSKNTKKDIAVYGIKVHDKVFFDMGSVFD